MLRALIRKKMKRLTESARLTTFAQVVIFGQRGKELHNRLVPRRIAWITRLAKADRKREYLFTNLAEICSVALPTEARTHLC